MHFIKILSAVALLMSVHGHVEVRRGGWLNRIVQYHKQKFLEDFKQIAPIKINVSIMPTPEGYQDSKKWNFKSVMHLLVLIKESDPALPVRRALRRMMTPTRRHMLTKDDSFKYFPSLGKISPNEIYYDFDPEVEGTTSEYSEESEIHHEIEKPSDSGIIVISNPVEAKLPSAAISIKLLQDILLNRAIAARKMPTSTAIPITWIPNHDTDDEYNVDSIESTTIEASGDETDENADGVTEENNEPEDYTGNDQTTLAGTGDGGDVVGDDDEKKDSNNEDDNSKKDSSDPDGKDISEKDIGDPTGEGNNEKDIADPSGEGNNEKDVTDP